MPRDLSALVDALFVLLTFAEDLHAETLAAPFGGKAITVPDDRVACTVEGGWTFGPDHRSLKPPTDEASVGQSVEIAAAANDASCATSKARITLLTTGLWPAFDLQTVIAMVDDARVEAKGKRLRGVHLGWSSTGQHGDDVCLSSQQDGAVERCVWGLGTSLPADPTAIALAWSPAGTRGAHDETLFDAEGHRASSDATRLPIARVAVGPLMRPNISLDAALGRGSLTLKHAEAVSGAECAPASCGMDGGAVIVGLVPASTSALSIRIKLAPRVVLRSGDTSDPAPVIRVPITRCPLALVSGTMLREVESQRLVLRVEGRCAKEVDTLRFLVGPTLAVLERSVADGSAAFVVLRVARVDGAQLPITVVREEGDNFVVAQTTAYTQSSPMVHVVLEMGNHRVIDFVPHQRRGGRASGRAIVGGPDRDRAHRQSRSCYRDGRQPPRLDGVRAVPCDRRRARQRSRGRIRPQHLDWQSRSRLLAESFRLNGLKCHDEDRRLGTSGSLLAWHVECKVSAS